MTTQEMLLEIESIKKKLVQLPKTNVISREELTTALVILYDMYVEATSHKEAA